MSADAEDHVKTWSHPKVKGSARELLSVIARLIPEGETMTAPITIDDLATETGYYDQAVRKARDVLVDVGVLRIVGGGQGRTASYELLALPGAGADPALPLIGRARPPRAPADPDLFSEPSHTVDATPAPPAVDLRANNIGDFHRSWWSYFGDFHRSLRAYFGDFHRSWVLYFGDFHRSWFPLGVDDARARDVHTFKNVHTHGAAAAETRDAKPPPPIVHPWHVWCGLVCVPTSLHQEFLRKGHEAAWLLAFYARTCATLPAGEKIHVDDFQFWRRAFADEFATTARVRPPPAEGQTAGCRGGHEPPCERDYLCIERTLADARDARERKSG